MQVHLGPIWLGLYPSCQAPGSPGLFLFGLLVSTRSVLVPFNLLEKGQLQTLLNRGLPPVLRLRLLLLFLLQSNGNVKNLIMS